MPRFDSSLDRNFGDQFILYKSNITDTIYQVKKSGWNKFVSHLCFWRDYRLPTIIQDIQSEKLALTLTLESKLKNKVDHYNQKHDTKIPVIFQQTLSGNSRAPKKLASVAAEKPHNKLQGTVFVATNGASQHSPQYKAEVGTKTNFDKSVESVSFASASCTPLAISFAVSAKKVKSFADQNTPTQQLDSFLGNKEYIKRGIAEIRKMISNTRTGVTLDKMNLGAEDGLRVYNAMTANPITPKRTFSGTVSTCSWYDHEKQVGDMAESHDWYKTALKNLQKGEGAVVILGGYSIGVRRIEDAYEIFDSHNSNSYTGKAGASVIHCENADQLVKNLEIIRGSGAAASGSGAQAEALGIEIYVL